MDPHLERHGTEGRKVAVPSTRHSFKVGVAHLLREGSLLLEVA